MADLTKQTQANSMNIFDNMKQNQAGMSTALTPENIFSLIKKAYSGPSMGSILPAVQEQFSARNAAAAPVIAGIKQSGEERAAVAQSDAGARNMRGSDIEAAGMAGARNDAASKEAEFMGKMAMEEATFMADKIFESFKFDKDQNTQLHTQLAQAIGQELSQQREIEMAEKQLKMRKKELKQNGKNSLLSSLITAAGSVMGGPAGGILAKGAGSLFTDILMKFKPNPDSVHEYGIGEKVK